MTLFGPDDDLGAPPIVTFHRPKWTAVSGKRCDQCVAVAMRDRLQRIAPARLRRVFDESDMRLCYEHARPLREADERTYA